MPCALRETAQIEHGQQLSSNVRKSLHPALGAGMRVTEADNQHSRVSRGHQKVRRHAERHPTTPAAAASGTVPVVTARLRFSNSLSSSKGRSRRPRKLVSGPLVVLVIRPARPVLLDQSCADTA